MASELADSVEVKMTLSVDNLSHSLKALDYDRNEAEIRKIYFIDTKNLDLYKQDILLRLRVGDDENSDVTVKQRPADDEIDWSEYEEEDGFKCEADITKNKNVTSCSLSEDVDDIDAEGIVSEDEEIKSAFSKTQKNLLEILEVDLDWDKVKVLGPITSTSWKIKFEGQKISVEMWKLKSGETFLEISAKGDLSEVSSLKKSLKNLSKDLLLKEESSAISKTEFALKKLTSRK